MNDQELITAVRASVAGARMKVPAEQVTSRGRAIRAGRRRYVAATATATAGAAAVAGAIVLPGPAPAVQHAQDTAYVTSHVTKALETVPATTVFFARDVRSALSTESDTWTLPGRERRVDTRTLGGQQIQDSGTTTHGASTTTVNVNYRDKTWSRSTSRAIGPSLKETAPAKAGYVCHPDSVPAGIALYPDPAGMATALRGMESCGQLTADGTTTVDGVTVIKLIASTGAYTFTWYVNPTTYLPAHVTVTESGTTLWQLDIQWLPPTAANLAELKVTPPPGFTQIPG